MHEIGARFVVKGTWDAAPTPAGRLEILLNPAPRVFGVGTHPSTRMFVDALEQVVRLGDVVADIGTGNGILAIAAIRLGAREAYATDLSPVALEAARANFASNGLDGRIDAALRTFPQVQGLVDLVVCNIDRLDVIGEVIAGSLALLKKSGMLVILPVNKDVPFIDATLAQSSYTETGTREGPELTMKLLVKD